jgi:hypothetical protein
MIDMNLNFILVEGERETLERQLAIKLASA